MCACLIQLHQIILFGIHTKVDGSMINYCHLVSKDLRGKLEDPMDDVHGISSHHCGHYNRTAMFFSNKPGSEFKLMNVRISFYFFFLFSCIVLFINLILQYQKMLIITCHVDDRVHNARPSRKHSVHIINWLRKCIDLQIK